MRSQLLLLLLITLSITSYSQVTCGFDIVHQKKMQTDPLYRKAVQDNERNIRSYISKNKSWLTARTARTEAVLYTIPVVVHVMHTGGAIGTIYNPTDAQIQGAINYLNQVYNGTYPGTQGIGDIQLQFVLATKNPSCNSSTGIDRVDASGISGYTTNGISSNYGTTPGVNELSIKNLSRWNPNQFYNIWVVNKIDGKDGTSGSFIAGYAYFPGASNQYDGTIMLATQMITGQKTLPHEIGHAFGLFHTFEGSTDRNTCPANTDCSVDGDAVCDTDPETYNQLSGVIDFSCRTGINVCTGTAYSINTESNYMNYTNCYTLFTAGQKARILAFAASQYRRSLATSIAGNAIYPMASYSLPVSASCSPTTSATGMGGGYAGILSVDLNNRYFPSSLAINDNGYVDGTTNCLNLVQLVRSNNYSLTVRVAGANQEQLRGWIDYNNDGAFNNATEQIVFNSSILTSSPSVSASFTVPSTAVVNSVLRMRIIDDLSTVYGVPSISSGCIDPTYGQAEDYPVYITANSVLPVTLNSFTGKVENNIALLSWNTSSEDNLKSFEIEKSTDSRNFQKIGIVDVAKKASSSNNYSFTDFNLSENNYYRLRMVDNNGLSKLSEIVLVHYNDIRQKVWVINNPFNNYIDMNFTKGGQVTKLQLINSLGVVVKEKVITAQAGKIRWDIENNTSKGSYIMKVFIGSEIFTYKLIKQ